MSTLTDDPFRESEKESSAEKLRRLPASIASADPVQKVRLLTEMAGAEATQGRLRDAELTLDRAERMLSDVDDEEAHLSLLLARGRLLALEHSPPRAAEAFREVWNRSRELGLLALAVHAAQALSTVDTPKLRYRWTLLALELAENVTEPSLLRVKGELHTALGKHYETMLEYPRAIESYDRAVRCFEQARASLAVLVARSLLARVYRRSKRIPEALNIQQEVLHDLSSKRSERGLVCEELGECLLALGRRDEAETYFKQAYEIAVQDEWFVNNESARLSRLKILGKAK